MCMKCARKNVEFVKSVALQLKKKEWRMQNFKIEKKRKNGEFSMFSKECASFGAAFSR